MVGGDGGGSGIGPADCYINIMTRSLDPCTVFAIAVLYSRRRAGNLSRK